MGNFIRCGIQTCSINFNLLALVVVLSCKFHEFRKLSSVIDDPFACLEMDVVLGCKSMEHQTNNTWFLQGTTERASILYSSNSLDN